MRSSKQRSRSKSNRNRSMGNIANRVFDSSGPEGKVRGTPQQIIDKYNQLARDAQLSGDRVAAENFQQHSEHYTRMLGEALREQEARREQQEREQSARRDSQDRDRPDRQQNNGGSSNDSNRDNEQVKPDPGAGEQPDTSGGASDVVDIGAEGADSGLVETPESRPSRPRRPRKPRKDDAGKAPETSDTPEAPEAAE